MNKLVLSLLLAVAFAVPAFSQMMDTPMREYKGGHGSMMRMGNMDKMDDMMGMCIEHANEIGLTDDQIMKLKPLHREMQKKRPGSKPTGRLQRSNLWKSWKLKILTWGRPVLQSKK